MPILRAILALLIGFSLLTAPISAAMAAQAMETGMAMEDCDKIPSKQAPSDCDCCDKANLCQTNMCGAQCAKLLGYLPTPTSTDIAIAQEFPRPASAAVERHSWPPPAPPPRT